MALFNIVPLYYVFGAFERRKIDYQTEEKKTLLQKNKPL